MPPNHISPSTYQTPLPLRDPTRLRGHEMKRWRDKFVRCLVLDCVDGVLDGEPLVLLELLGDLLLDLGVGSHLALEGHVLPV
jgi:hypothetical protein